MNDPLMPHLMDILKSPELQGLILAGGFGIRLKQDYLARTGAQTLIESIPPARATSDLDLFLKMEVFLNADLKDRIRHAIDNLGYEPTQANWQFAKPLGEMFPGKTVSLDLLSRHPAPGEEVRLKSPRVGAGVLHGRDTEEAFAIELDPLSIPLIGTTSEEESSETIVLVPHPYAWLNMKVRAAHDWLKMERGEIKRKPYSEKHPFDVYVLVAMLQADELARSRELASQFKQHAIAMAIRKQAQELFATPTSPGSLEARRQVGQDIDFETFYEGLREALEIEPQTEASKDTEEDEP